MREREKTTTRIRGTTPEIEAAARTMRRNPTPAEEALWQALRGRQLNGLKFRRQHPVGLFVLDFYCPTCKLVVEVDGGVHDSQESRDKARTEQLSACGYRVLRFLNDEVLNDMPSVLERIRQGASPV